MIDEKILWNAAEKLRDKVDPADYKNVILGLVFLKYVSDKYTNKYAELVKFNDDREKDPDEYKAENIFIVPEKAQWSYIAKNSKSSEIGQIIDNAFDLLEKNNEQLQGILPKTYSKSELDKTALGELIDDFTNDLVLHEDDGDFFGQIYEFYIGAFAKYIPAKGGEFFTPKCVVELMVDLLEPYKGRVYDPCCGSGGMFVQCSKFVKQHQGKIENISIFGQEINPGTWKMAKMNLAIRGLEGNLGNKNADSFTEDLHKNLKADFILANPPYNLKQYKILDDDIRWIFGLPNKKNANYAWLSLMCAKLSPTGKAAILMPNGATTSNTNDDKKLRKEMIEQNKIEAIIQLPDQLFANVGLSVQCWILNNNKQIKKFLFIKADNLGKKIIISKKPRNQIRILEEQEINKIVKTYKDFSNNNLIDVPGFCKKADFEEIKEKDFTLNPGTYVGAEESNKLSQEEIKIELKKASAELFELMKEGNELEKRVKEILEKEINE